MSFGWTTPGSPCDQAATRWTDRNRFGKGFQSWEGVGKLGSVSASPVAAAAAAPAATGDPGGVPFTPRRHSSNVRASGGPLGEVDTQFWDSLQGA